MTARYESLFECRSLQIYKLYNKRSPLGPLRFKIRPRGLSSEASAVWVREWTVTSRKLLQTRLVLGLPYANNQACMPFAWRMCSVRYMAMFDSQMSKLKCCGFWRFPPDHCSCPSWAFGKHNMKAGDYSPTCLLGICKAYHFCTWKSLLSNLGSFHFEVMLMSFF